MQYFPLFHDLRDRKVVVIGGGAAVVAKLDLFRRAGVRPTVFAMAPIPEVRELAATGHIALHCRAAQGGDLAGAALVVAAGDDGETEITTAARVAGIPVNVVDRPELSSAIMPAIVDRDPVLVAISTAGTSPVLARRLRARIEALLPPGLGQLARFAARFRRTVAATCPDPGDRRRLWERVLDGPIGGAVLAGHEAEAREGMMRLVNTKSTTEERAGSVALIGVGPGDPELLTLRAIRFMQYADVVLYDALIAPELFNYVRRDARRLDVGKRKGRHGMSQAGINRLMLAEARAGRRVARLKGGDPLIFGRGGEEAAFLKGHGIAVEIVPGITAALGAAAEAQIPLTHREHAAAVTFVTGHRRALGDFTPKLADTDHTLVVYMGVSQAEHLAADLIAAGRPATTPVAVLERATLPDRRTLRTTLAALPELMRREGVASPALLVVGEVAAPDMASAQTVRATG